MCMHISECILRKIHMKSPSLIISEIMDVRKRWLLKRLKGRASEDHAVINVLTGSKYCWNQQGITINLFFDAFGIYWVGKSLH